ncbi:single-stranded-DNA-specific exonuclease RecJ [Alkalicaulis satelles]|uniref:Single-stranded-DNA-specific exonuclease RecJ n=1 Tax=Alkalicaulis satelles TaxID=2609175 RepID=A0A5M6ZBV9_9PROT|nr:single-stranded-DNA-specific exonuclease RecJ [Alkalicaulis satelles]KAA5801630.1 single-stranded-DNA-specific exonuclease RecJ [Alkalicaulis satelles]
MSAGPLFGVTRSLGGRAWGLRPADDRAAGEIARVTGVNDALARLLAARGLTAESAPDFLSPRLRDSFPDPSSFKGMDDAARLIWDAVEKGVRIALFADYDVDGATSAAQLSRWLSAVSEAPLIYVPDRIEEGYGPSAAAFESLKARGAGLVITLDCGAAAVGPLASARAMGLPVAVIDHHLMDGPAPEAEALVNPNQPGDESGCGHLAAAGVVFVLLAALNREGRARGAFRDRPEPDLLALADLAALGTVCDVVPLTGFNRALTAQGLRVMSAWTRPGLAALAEIAGVTGPASVYHAGFIIGPRINAGGRVGRSDLGARLLTSDDMAEARSLAAELDQHNAARRAIEADVLDEAMAQLERAGVSEDAPVLIAAGEHWHPGVIGIAAGRVKERFNRPAIVIGIDPDTGLAKGSGRSCTGVNLGAAVARARETGLLIAGGGHAMACGLTVEAGRIDALRDFLTEALADEWVRAEAARTLELDAVAHPASVSFEFCEALKAAAPFGQGNPEPRFAFADLRRSFAKRVGSDHVRVSFEAAGGARLDAIAFRCADAPMGQALLAPGEARFHAAGKLRAEDNRFGKRAELHLEDLAPAP